MFKNLLVPLDGSKLAEAILPAASSSTILVMVTSPTRHFMCRLSNFYRRGAPSPSPLHEGRG